MNTVELLTIIFIVVLVIITILTIYVMYSNSFAIKESFYGSKHNCYHDSLDHNSRNSFRSKSKGWCTTGDYRTKTDSEFDDAGESKVVCPYNYYRVKPDESVGFNSKSWCKRVE
jgi:hypothetical protein